MIPQTTLSRNKAQTALASSPSRRVTNTRAWHALQASFVTRLLEVNPNQGLTASEVATRRLLYGPNNSETLGSQRITGMLSLLFLSIVVGFLLTAAILNSAIGDSVEAFAILVVVVIGAIIGFAHVLKAARALDSMQYATRATVQVRREGQDANIKAEDLVPGDIVILTPGDIVPADARLQTVQLRAKESVLTGKHAAVDKRVSQVVTDAPIAKRQSMVYLGTTIDFGSAVAVVVATGIQTELGKTVVRDN